MKVKHAVLIKLFEFDVKFMLNLQIGQIFTYLEFGHTFKLYVCQILYALPIQLLKMPEIHIRLKMFYRHSPWLVEFAFEVSKFYQTSISSRSVF